MEIGNLLEAWWELGRASLGPESSGAVSWDGCKLLFSPSSQGRGRDDDSNSNCSNSCGSHLPGVHLHFNQSPEENTICSQHFPCTELFKPLNYPVGAIVLCLAGMQFSREQRALAFLSVA